MTTVTVEILGVLDLVELFGDVQEVFTDGRTLDEATAILLNRQRTRFLSETDPDGRKWPRSEAARTGRGRRTGPGKTLFDTGTLFQSIQASSSGMFDRNIGTDVEYGLFHQEGTSRLPKREFLGVNDQDADIIERLFVERINAL